DNDGHETRPWRTQLPSQPMSPQHPHRKHPQNEDLLQQADPTEQGCAPEAKEGKGGRGGRLAPQPRTSPSAEELTQHPTGSGDGSQLPDQWERA
ncbi:MAG: hypothetical protein ABIV06_00820, partial [Thermoanaerobaculia bacterium]